MGSKTVSGRNKMNLLASLLIFVCLIGAALCHKRCYVWADPHIITFDNLRYDVFASGEFVVFKNEPLLVTMRTAKHSCSGGGCLDDGVPGWTYAVGYRYKGTTFAFYARKKNTLTINGKTVDLPANSQWNKFGEVRIRRKKTEGWELHFPGSRYSYIFVHRAQRYIDFDMRVAGKDKNVAKGLCGFWDGSKADNKEFIGRDGTTFTSKKHKSYRFALKFVQHWHTLENEQLFEEPTGSFWAGYRKQVRYQKTHYIKTGKVKKWSSPQTKQAAQRYCDTIKHKNSLDQKEMRAACMYDARQGVMSANQVKKLAAGVNSMNAAGLTRHKEHKSILQLVEAIKRKIITERQNMKDSMENRGDTRKNSMRKLNKDLKAVNAKKANAEKRKNTAAGQIATAKQAFQKASGQYNALAGEVKAQTKGIQLLKVEHTTQKGQDTQEWDDMYKQTSKELNVLKKIEKLLKTGKA